MKYLALALLILISFLACYQALYQPEKRYHWPLAQGVDEVGLRPVDCWFGDNDGLPPVECYDMRVPEQHSAPGSRYITFPVMVFRSQVNTEKRSPLLYLGAGGPGAPMYLDDYYSIKDLVGGMAKASLNQGRDLIVIDPRGSGKARPMLTCGAFIEGARRRFRLNLTLEQTRDSVAADYQACIAEFLDQNIDHTAYNSFAVARDIEALRRAAGIERWVLFGVSYAANYALTIANEYPDTVESMVLDSAFVSRVGLHESYIEQMTRPYRLLFNYCKYDPDCRQPVNNVKARFWAIYEKLEQNPISIEIEHAGDQVPILIDGNRFIEAMWQGIYGTDIYRDLPYIIEELENGQYISLEPYLWLYVDLMLSPTWGDVSGMAHYCYEEKPLIDFAQIRAQFDQLPAGYIRDSAPVFLDWPDLCEQMQIFDTAPNLIPSRKLSTPTLILHGKLDSITPLSRVRKILKFFRQAHLLTFDLGHSILTSSDCALNSMANFVDDASISRRRLECG